MKNLIMILAFIALIPLATLSQSTAFTFQGRLNDGTAAATGNVQLQIRLYDSLTGGMQIDSTVNLPSVVLINGVFSTELDFGGVAFDGSPRFVEIGVRPAGSSNQFTILSPRQHLSSVPYSIKSGSSTSADVALDSNKLGGVDASQYVTTTTGGNSFIKNAATQQTGNFNISGNGFFGGNVGIGTANPTTKLQVVQANGYGITQTDGFVTVGSFINSAGGWLGTKSNHSLNFFTNDSQPQMTLTTAGNFGVGTTNPTTKLFVLSSDLGNSAIYGESLSGPGVTGKSIGSRGVFGESTSLGGVGVYARNVSGGRAIVAEGNVSQDLSSFGVVKAMVAVDAGGTITRCYNGLTNASSGTCGFTITRPNPGPVGRYQIDFGFVIDDRIISVTAQQQIATTAGFFLGAGFFFFPDHHTLEVRTFATNVEFTSAFANDAFTLIAY